jgi:carbon starvation protein CstA
MGKKYSPLIVVIIFTIMMFITAVIVSVVKHLFEGGSILEMLEAPAFIALFAILMGIIYCEIAYRIKNIIFSSLLFGLIASQSFIAFNVGLLWVKEGIIREITLGWYLAFTLLFGGVLSALYYGFTSKK